MPRGMAAFETEVRLFSGTLSRSRHYVPYRYFEKPGAACRMCNVLMIAVRPGPRPTTTTVVNAEIFLQKLGPRRLCRIIARGFGHRAEAALVAALQTIPLPSPVSPIFEKEPHPPGR